MNRSLDSLWTPAYSCRECGNGVGYRSRKRTFTERRILPLFLLKPVRCAECFHRDYRLIFTPVRRRPSTTAPSTNPKMGPASVPPIPHSDPKRNVA
jgi:hypothetical protein